MPTEYIWSFCPATGSFARHRTDGDIPPPTCGAAAAVIGARIIIFGGYRNASKTVSNDVFVLDLETFVWKQLAFPTDAPLPSSRDRLVAWAWAGAFYIFGGWGEERGALNGPEDKFVDFGQGMINNQMLKLQDWDNDDDRRWESVSAAGRPPSARHSAAHCATDDGDVFLYGGVVAKQGRSQELFRFQSRTETWSHISLVVDPPVALSDATLSPLSPSKLLLCGGKGKEKLPERRCWKIDVGRGAASEVATLPPLAAAAAATDGKEATTGIWRHKAVVAKEEGKIFLVGGQNRERISDYLVEIDLIAEFPGEENAGEIASLAMLYNNDDEGDDADFVDGLRQRRAREGARVSQFAAPKGYVGRRRATICV